MISIDVRSTIRSPGVWAEFFGGEGSKLVKQATMRALNRGIDAARTNTSREIRKIYNIKHRAVLKLTSIERASRNRLIATLMLGGKGARRAKRIPLIEFDARWRPGMAIGASVKIKVGGARKNVRAAFIAAATRNNASGGGSAGMRQVFRRQNFADTSERYPIVSLRSLSIPQAFANKVVMAAVRKAALDVFARTYHQQLTYLRTLDG